jgi:hypothetical protein
VRWLHSSWFSLIPGHFISPKLFQEREKMKSFRYLLTLALCLGMTGFARAAAIDVNLNVLDPTYEPGLTSILNTGSFAVTFHPCSYYGSSVPSSLNGYLCFEGINESSPSVSWVSLDLTFTNPSLGSCGIFSSIPAGTTSIFSVPPSTCTQVGSTYDLAFSGGSIDPGDVFLIAELGDTNPADFAGAIGTVSATPEPGSFVLLSSGTLIFGTLLFAERRRLQRNPIRS